jgi:16S rRNA (uracil1498-N3)-methyltransferase
MPRFYVPQPKVQDGMLRVEGDEAKHIRKVLRLKPGDEIVVFNGAGKEYEGPIIEEGSSSVVIRVRSIASSQSDSPLEIALAQSLLKGEKMDYLIQKATELGVKQIIPFFSSRTIPLLEESRRLKRYHRWKKIALEASKQCGRGLIPQIEPLQSFFEMIQEAGQDRLRFILWEKEGMRLKEVLKKRIEKSKIFFVVGPEGGFTQEEVDRARREGFIPVHLGRRTLRSETSSLCFLSILQYEYGDIG